MAGCIPRLYAAASLKRARWRAGVVTWGRIPRLYAAASLKPVVRGPNQHGLCGIPRLYAAASLKLPHLPVATLPRLPVFRSSMPRPH